MPLFEYEGMVLLRWEDTTRQLVYLHERLARLRESDKPFESWHFERGANHIHPFHQNADERTVREGLEIADAFQAALREQFPDRSFVITHNPDYAVSFYSRTPEAPVEDEPSRQPLSDSSFCYHCQRKIKWLPLVNPPITLRQTIWGTCPKCDTAIIIRAGEIREVLEARIANR